MIELVVMLGACTVAVGLNALLGRAGRGGVPPPGRRRTVPRWLRRLRVACRRNCLGTTVPNETDEEWWDRQW